MDSRANATRAKTGGLDELRYIATRHDAKERMVDWIVAVTIAGGILVVLSQKTGEVEGPMKRERMKLKICFELLELGGLEKVTG